MTRFASRINPRTVLKFLIIICCGSAVFHVVRYPIEYSEGEESSQKLKEEQTDIPPECVCPSTDSSSLHDFCYYLPSNKSARGAPFDCRHMSTLEKLGLINAQSLVDLTQNNSLPEPVFVTAFSENHAAEARRQLKLIRQYWPKRKVIVYDLGFGIETFKFYTRACNVDLRPFDFSLFPPRFRRLTEFRWKPIIIAETLKEFGAIFYMDSSITFKKADLSHVYGLVTCRSTVTENNRPALPSIEERDLRENITVHESGWDRKQYAENTRECRKSAYLFHGYSGHGIYPVTNPGLYKFIPTDETEIRKPKAKMYEAGFVFAVRTKEVIENILKWYVMCALEDDCMAPSGSSIGCSFAGKDRFRMYAGCHRYDQSVVNLLAANSFHFDRHYYTSEIVDFFNVVRSAGETVTADDIRCDR